MWGAVAYVSSGFTLAAFIAAVVAWVLKGKSEEKGKLISLADTDAKARLVQDTLEFFHVNADNLNREQQYSLALTQIKNRASRFKTIAILIGVLSLLAAALSAYAIEKVNSHIVFPSEILENDDGGVVVAALNLSPGFERDWGNFMTEDQIYGDVNYLTRIPIRFQKACENHTAHIMNRGIDIDLCKVATFHFATNGISGADVAFDIVLLNENGSKNAILSSIDLEIIGYSRINRAYGDYIPPQTIAVKRNVNFDLSTFPIGRRTYSLDCYDEEEINCAKALGGRRIIGDRSCSLVTNHTLSDLEKIAPANCYIGLPEWKSNDTLVRSVVFEDPYVLTPGEPLRIRAGLSKAHFLGNRFAIRFILKIKDEKLKTDTIYLHYS